MNSVSAKQRKLWIFSRALLALAVCVWGLQIESAEVYAASKNNSQKGKSLREHRKQQQRPKAKDFGKVAPEQSLSTCLHLVAGSVKLFHRYVDTVSDLLDNSINWSPSKVLRSLETVYELAPVAFSTTDHFLASKTTVALMNAVKKAEAKPPREFVEAYEELMGRHLQNIEPDLFVPILVFFAEINHRPKFMPFLIKRIWRNLNHETFNLERIVIFLHYVTLTAPNANPLFVADLFAAIRKKELTEELPFIHQNTLYRAAKYWKVVQKLDFEFPRSAVYQNEVEVESITSFQQESYEKLKQAGFPVTLEALIPEVGVRVDLLLDLPNQKVAIELDGERHYYSGIDGVKRLVFKDQRRDELLRAAGYQVIRIMNAQAEEYIDNAIESAKASQ